MATTARATAHPRAKSPAESPAKPPDPTRPEPTAEQFALAWRQMRNRGGCPDTLEATLEHRVWSRALHGLAVNLGRRAATGPGPAAQAASRLSTHAFVPPDPKPPVRATFPHLAGIDRKRLAANDRD